MNREQNNYQKNNLENEENKKTLDEFERSQMKLADKMMVKCKIKNFFKKIIKFD